MLNLTAQVRRFDEDYIYLTDLKENGRPIDVDSHRMYAGRWSKRITSASVGSIIAFNAEIEQKTISGFDGEERYTANRLSIRKPSMAQVIRSA